MKKLLLYICFFVHVIDVAAQKTDVLPRPKLVVGIVVDQMRWDYLYKYYDRYGQDGFKRLMKEGYNCQNTMINYLPSFTGPGHTCIYTGSVPAIHGITANDWIGIDGEGMYCVEDHSVKSIGGSVKAGRMSPRNLNTTTITDELRIATKQRSKVFGVGIKDRGSILPAGHNANAAFWFDDSTGNFITSSYYMNELPAWLVKFNNRRWADTLSAQVWEPLYPLSTYINSTPDNMSIEGTLKGEDAPVFPHKVATGKRMSYSGLRIMPAGNILSLKAARACIKGEQLGQRGETDFLCITLSTTDYAGHNYGPDAVEMEDMYLRLDMELAKMLRYLDNKIGKGKYTVFLTADHGAAHNSEYLNGLKIPAGTETQSDATRKLNTYLKEEAGSEALVRGLYNYQVYLNEQYISEKGLDRNNIKKLVTEWLYKQNGVAMVADMENVNIAMLPEPVRTMVVNGYYRGRSGCMQIVMKPGWYSGYGKTGTTHGTWNPYDTHIPLLWYGWGVPEGETYRTVHMTDISATLAAMLHIQMPNGCTGSVITELFED